MRSYGFCLVLAACASPTNVEGFGREFRRLPSSSSLHAATVGSSSNDSGRGKSLDSSKSPRTLSLHEQREMDTIKEELVAKYLDLGHSEEYAKREVDYFLQDSERSQQYVQMRRVAMAREGNDLGIEDLVQFVLAFVIGMSLSGLHDIYQILVRGNLSPTEKPC